MRKRMAAGYAGAFLLTAAAAGALDWPSPESQLRSSFGQNRLGRPALGLTFAAPAAVQDVAVRSADSGELVFSQDADQRINGWPVPLGAWRAVRQSDGLILIYGRLAAFGPSTPMTLAEKGALIGRSGTTGWSAGSGFYFAVFDALQVRWVNPALLAPPRADRKAPSVRSAVLIGRDGQSIDLGAVKTLRQGYYRLVVETYDTEDGIAAPSLAPAKLFCLVNGAEQGALNLETIAAPAGALETAGLSPRAAAAVYARWPAYELGELRLSRGRGALEIIIRDANGNERVASYVLNVE